MSQRELADVVAEARHVVALGEALAARGIELGAWRAASAYAAIFDVVRFPDAPAGARMIAKLPWRLGAPASDHPDVVERGHGPSLPRLVSPTGPFVFDAPASEEDVCRLVEAPAAHQRDRGVAAPLAPLVALLEVAGRPLAIYEETPYHDLAWMIAHWPGRARRVLPRLARALRGLHATYGPHGDLKPEHVRLDFDGQQAPVLIDPLGPLTGELFGSFGWQLPLPIGVSPLLADIVALSQVVAACWGDGQPWRGRLASALHNLHNGRFACNVRPSALRAEAAVGLPHVPEPWRAWALTGADALLEAWCIAENARWVQGARACDPGWIDAHLAALAAIPPWSGDDRG